MKKTLLVLVVALVSLPAFAADSLVSAGSILLGGGSNFLFDYNSYTSEPDVEEDVDPLTTTTMGVGLYGKLGYFVIDSLAVGPILGINYKSVTADYYTETGDVETADPVTTMGFDFGPWVGYYFDLGSALYPYVSAGFLLNYSSTDDPNTESSTSGMLYGPALWAGALASFADGWALDFGLVFKYLFGKSTYEPDEGDSVDTNITTMDIGLFAGIDVFF